MLMAILWQFIKALFMITPTQQIVCSIVSRQLIADQSPTSCRPIATYFQSVGNQLPISHRPIADWSLIFRDSCRRPVADWSATGKRSFWSHSGCIGCSCFIVTRQSPTGCSACMTGVLYKNVNLREAAPTSSPNIAHSAWMHNTLWNAIFTSLIG